MASDDKQLKIVAPSNFKMIKDLRLRKDLKMLPCPYMKPETSLRYYQTVGSLNMLMSNRMLLGDSPGTGKTIQTISTQAVLKHKDPTMKFLVATIKSSKRQWGKEFAKFSQGMTYHVLQDDYKPIGGKAKLTGFKAREAQYKDFKDVDVLITGYHPIKEDYKLLVECRGPNFMVVFDECQEFKNEKTKANIFFVAAAIDICSATAANSRHAIFDSSSPPVPCLDGLVGCARRHGYSRSRRGGSRVRGHAGGK